MKRTWFAFLLGLLACAATAQPQPVKWSAKLVPEDIRAGESGQIIATATVEKGWHVYSITQGGDLIPTTLGVEQGGPFLLSNPPVEPTPTRAHDENFDIPVAYHVGSTAFGIPVTATLEAKGSGTFNATVRFQACNDKGCLPPQTLTIPVRYAIAPGATRPERIPSPTDIPPQPADHEEGKNLISQSPSKSESKSGSVGTTQPVDDVQKQIQEAEGRGLIAFFLFAFGFGLLALLTPCVFPMVPITVSYFTKQKTDTRGGPIKLATAYCAGIIGTFTGLGLLMTALFGAAGIQKLATNPYVNLGVAALFIVLALNLFGVFELKLPSGLVNKAGSASRTKTGIAGPILMGLTFSLTTFTCTVPFVGSLLAGAASGGYLYPAVGMLGFSVAISIPFFFLAVFPQYLSKLPKSGSWLATVKAFMGFLELAAAVKFLSNADLVWQLGIITRPVFLSLWVLLFGLAALYLFGAIRLGNESGELKIGIPRLVVGLATTALAAMCINGLRGAELGELGAFLPPEPYPGQHGTGPGSIAWETNYQSAIEKAKREGKPLFINFTGVTCTNCRWMEQNMFPKPDVIEALQNYIPVELFTDRTTEEDLMNRSIQEKLTGQITLPVYVLVSPSEKVLGIFPGLTRDQKEFVQFLKTTDGKVAAR